MCRYYKQIMITVRYNYFRGAAGDQDCGVDLREEQGFKLRLGCEIVIATPERLIDVLENR